MSECVLYLGWFRFYHFIVCCREILFNICNSFFKYLSSAICLSLQWEKKCKQLKSEDVSTSAGSCRPLFSPSNDIHNELNYKKINNFDKNVVHTLESSFSNGVMPLQYHTNEKYQVSHSELFGVPKVGSLLHDATSFSSVETLSCTDLWNLKDLTGSYNLLHHLLFPKLSFSF